MTSTTASNVITALKAIFARHGIPVVLMSDNGPQFNCKEMKEFAEAYNFKHVTSSPLYPQSNGLAERSVRTVRAVKECWGHIPRLTRLQSNPTTVVPPQSY